MAIDPIPVSPHRSVDARGRALPMTAEEIRRRNEEAIRGLDALDDIGTEEEQRETLDALLKALDEDPLSIGGVTSMPRPESKTLGYLYDRFIGDDPEQVASYEKARASDQSQTRSRLPMPTAAPSPLYLDLIRRFPLRPLRSDDDLERAIAVAEALDFRGDLADDERDYLDVLLFLIERFEDEHHPIPDVDGL